MSPGNDNFLHSRWRLVLVGAVVALTVIIAQGTAFAASRQKNLVNINTASQKELEAVKGVKRATAKKIIANRPYKSLEELSKAGLSTKNIGSLKSSLTTGAAPAAAEKKAGAESKRETGSRVNLNTATQKELQKIPGIGPRKAKAIIKGRPYKSPEDIMKVRGIKKKTYKKIKDMITVN